MKKLIFALVLGLGAFGLMGCNSDFWEALAEDYGECPSGGAHRISSYPDGTSVIGENTCKGAATQRGYKYYCWASSVSHCYGYEN